MNIVFDDSCYDALILWAFAPAPIGRPCPHPIRFDTVRFGTSVDVMIGGTGHAIIGITPSSWLANAGIGWRKLIGGSGSFDQISSACKVVQARLIEDRRAFNAALHRCASQPNSRVCTGLPVFDLGGGRDAIRPDDIYIPEVRAAFRRFLDSLGPDLDGRLIGDLRVTATPDGYADSILWWWFAREWKGEEP